MAHTFSSNLFGFSNNLQLLATEVSRLEHAARTDGASIWQRIFPVVSDDQGFVVRSEQTGVEAVWFVNDIDVRDGEIQGWRLKPTLETVARIPSLKGVRMLVVNT